MLVRGLVSVNFTCEVVFDLIRLSDSILRTDRIMLKWKDRSAQGKISPSVTLLKINSTWIILEPNLDFRDENVRATLHTILKVGPYQFICHKITFLRNRRNHKMHVNYITTLVFQFQLLSKSNCLYIYIYTYLLTLWSTVLLEKLTDSQLVKKFLSIYATRKI